MTKSTTVKAFTKGAKDPASTLHRMLFGKEEDKIAKLTEVEQAIQSGTTTHNTTKGATIMKTVKSFKSIKGLQTIKGSKAYASATTFTKEKANMDYVKSTGSTVWASIKSFCKDLYAKTQKMMPVVAKSASTYAVASVAAMVTGGSILAFGLTAIAFYAFMEWVIAKIKGTEYSLSKSAATGLAYSVVGTFLATFVFVLTANFAMLVVLMFL